MRKFVEQETKLSEEYLENISDEFLSILPETEKWSSNNFS